MQRNYDCLKKMLKYNSGPKMHIIGHKWKKRKQKINKVKQIYIKKEHIEKAYITEM